MVNRPGRRSQPHRRTPKKENTSIDSSDDSSQVAQQRFWQARIARQREIDPCMAVSADLPRQDVAPAILDDLRTAACSKPTRQAA